jgi:hypothetical protein
MNALHPANAIRVVSASLAAAGTQCPVHRGAGLKQERPLAARGFACGHETKPRMFRVSLWSKTLSYMATNCVVVLCSAATKLACH